MGRGMSPRRGKDADRRGGTTAPYASAGALAMLATREQTGWATEEGAIRTTSIFMCRMGRHEWEAHNTKERGEWDNPESYIKV